MERISDIRGGILSFEPETRVYTADSIEEIRQMSPDGRKCFYTSVLADVCNKYILVERTHSRDLSHNEMQQENIELDKILSAELKKNNLPFKEALVTFFDDSAVPEYISYKYKREKKAIKPSALTLLLPFFLP